MLQRDRHGRPVFGTFAAGEANAVQSSADLAGEGKQTDTTGFINVRKRNVDLSPEKKRQSCFLVSALVIGIRCRKPCPSQM